MENDEELERDLDAILEFIFPVEIWGQSFAQMTEDEIYQFIRNLYNKRLN